MGVLSCSLFAFCRPRSHSKYAFLQMELFPALHLPSVDSVLISNKLSSRWELFPALYLPSVDSVLIPNKL